MIPFWCVPQPFQADCSQLLILHPQWIACTGLGSAAVADMLIAVTMCWYLYQSRTGFPSYAPRACGNDPCTLFH